MIADLSMPSCNALAPEDLVRDLKHLPAAPRVLPRLKRLLKDGNSAMHEIVELVRLDSGLAARVLRVGNSAYFSQGIHCVTVEDAVARVGFEQVYELVSYAVSSQVLVRPLDAYALEADEVWRRSVACALAAEALAERTNHDPQAAYTAGLLHAIGMVVIDEWALRHRPALVLRHDGFPRETVESERREFGFTNAEAGEALLRHWEFPRAMCEPVRWQYAPRASATHASMACLLYAAKWVRSAVCAATPAQCPPVPHALQLQPLTLAPSVLPEIAAAVSRRLTAVSSVLELSDTFAGDRPGSHAPADQT